MEYIDFIGIGTISLTMILTFILAVYMFDNI